MLSAASGRRADRRRLPATRRGDHDDRRAAAAFGCRPRHRDLGAARHLRHRDQAARARRHGGGGGGPGADRVLRRLRPSAGAGGNGAHRCGRRRGRRCAGGGDPVRDQRPHRHPRPGPGQRRHGLPSALHRVDHDPRRPDPGSDQGRLPARPPRDRRRHDEGQRSQLRRGLRRAHRGDRRPAGADRLRSAPRRPRLAAGAGGGAGGEPLPGGGLPVAGRLQGAAARPRPARLHAGAAAAAPALVSWPGIARGP